MKNLRKRYFSTKVDAFQTLMSNNFGNSSTGSDRIVDQLVLDIKSLMLLNPSDESLRKLVEDKIVSSRDDQVVEFVGMLQSRRSLNVKGSILAALGEMVLASFLVIVGLAILAPSMVGFGSPDQLSNYFIQIASSWSVQSFAGNPVVPAIEFVLALVLLLGAFYNLRIAAMNLESVKSTGEAPSRKNPRE
ncbi:MAG: hypothetical protein ACREBS_10135 [Nitrososphaerales archaeon]